jgi:hypothetical protein
VAAKWYREAADHGFPVAEYAFVICLGNGERIDQNIPEMERYLKSVADHGHLEAQCLLGSRLRFTGDPKLGRQRRWLVVKYLAHLGNVLAERVRLRSALHYKRSRDGDCFDGSEAFGKCLEFETIGVRQNGLEFYEWVGEKGISDRTAAAAASGVSAGTPTAPPPQAVSENDTGASEMAKPPLDTKRLNGAEIESFSIKNCVSHVKTMAEAASDSLVEVNSGGCLETGNRTEINRPGASAIAESPPPSTEAESAISAPPGEPLRPFGFGKGWSGSSLEPRQYAGPILAGPSPMAPGSDSGHRRGKSAGFGDQSGAWDMARPGTASRTEELPLNTRSVREDASPSFRLWNNARKLTEAMAASRMEANSGFFLGFGERTQVDRQWAPDSSPRSSSDGDRPFTGADSAASQRTSTEPAIPAGAAWSGSTPPVDGACGRSSKNGSASCCYTVIWYGECSDDLLFTKVSTNGAILLDHGKTFINVNAKDPADCCPEHESQSSDRLSRDAPERHGIVGDAIKVAAQETPGVDSPFFASEMEKVLDFERQYELSALLFRIALTMARINKVTNLTSESGSRET